MCLTTITPSEDWGKLKQESRIKALSNWLFATAISVFSFLFLLMLMSGANRTNSTGAILACRGVICGERKATPYVLQ